MYLTREEEDMLSGKKGKAVQKAMEILVQLGQIYGASKLIPVNSVHMPGSSIVVTGEAGVEFIEQLARDGAGFAAETALNPAAMDMQCWRELNFECKDYDCQKRLTTAYVDMGAIPLHTCTPYHNGIFPQYGQHIAWGESSAIVLANSIFGAYTNREGGPSAVASALTGRTPLYGYHLEENRRATVLVNVIEKPVTISDYGALGYFVGEACRERVPVFTGMEHPVTMEQFKALGAALASSGSIALFKMVGCTPDASTVEEALGYHKPEAVVDYGSAQREQSHSLLNSTRGGEVDLVALGCPHASIFEIKSIASYLANKGKRCKSILWIMTSFAVKKMAEDLGYAAIIEQAGGKMVADTCLVLGALKPVILKYGFKNIATNSAKTAHYAPGQWSLGCYYGSLKQCLQAALSGKWEGEDK